jgi:DNA-binding transcriptional LysR family regulator
MDLRHLVTFQTVVEKGSLARAAEALDYAQSTVTLHIQQLEADLGVALFARVGRRLELTEAGRAMREQTGQFLRQVTALRQHMAELGTGDAGHVCLGAIEPVASLRLPAILVRYSRAHPKVRLDVEVGGTPAISGRVASGELDAGICSPPAASLGLRFEPLFSEPLVLLAPDDHQLARCDRVIPADLAGQRLLLTEPTCAYRQTIERALLERGAGFDTSIAIGSMAVLTHAVASGLGAAIVPLAIVTPAPAGTVVRPVEGLPLSLPIGLVQRADAGCAPPSRALGALLAMLRHRLRARK